MDDANLKSVVNDLVLKLTNLFKITISKRDSDNTIKKFYEMGHNDVETKFDLNIKPNSRELAFLKEYSFQNIKNFNEEMKDRLRKELSQGLIANENNTQLMKRVSDVLKLSKQRASTIVRTEVNRTFNAARESAAQSSGLKLVKYLNVALDDRTSGICQRMHKKYGNADKAIPMNRKFKDKVSGKDFDTPPFHPNCRTRVVYVPK